MADAKGQLQTFMQCNGLALPVYKNESYGENHRLQWSSTVVFPNGSNVSIFPILRSKKDADKAVAYKALTIGVERLLNAVITIPEDRDEDLKMMMCLLNTEKGQGDVVPPPVNRPVVSQPMTEAPSQPIKPSESTHIIRRTIDNGVVQDSDGYIKVPFVFPSSSEVPDVVSVLHNSCMESMTSRRQVFGFGSEQAWTSAWMNGLVSCLGCNGVVLVPSQSLLSQVVDTLGKVRNPPSFTVCSGEMQPSYLQPCVITDADLRQIDMNVVFPTERPIMIIDDSPNWSTSWDWLSYLPTFHISCFCVTGLDGVSIQIAKLRDLFNADLVFKSSYVF
ncbi:hypothetical protein WA588_003837 [Blastocystis sp. NMH]